MLVLLVARPSGRFVVATRLAAQSFALAEEAAEEEEGGTTFEVVRTRLGWLVGWLVGWFTWQAGLWATRPAPQKAPALRGSAVT